MKKLALVGALVFLGTGCSVISPYPIGFIYTGVKAPSPLTQVEAQGKEKSGASRGEACASGVLGLFAWGDASIDTAKKAGRITDVHAIDYSNQSILGALYTKSCTIVTGQ